jgi:glutaredoxin
VMNEYDYTIIGRNDCPWCEKAKDLILSLDKTFYYINITNNQAAKDILKIKGHTFVPAIWNKYGEYIGGFAELERYLDLPKPPQVTPIWN